MIILTERDFLLSCNDLEKLGLALTDAKSDVSLDKDYFQHLKKLAIYWQVKEMYDSAEKVNKFICTQWYLQNPRYQYCYRNTATWIETN